MRRLVALAWLVCLFFSVMEGNETYYLPESSSFYQADVGPSNARLEAGYTCGRFIGLKHSYAELGLFISPALSNGLRPIADLRVYRITESRWAASMGLGLRRCDDCTYRVQGVNLYYDFRDGCYGGFHRMGVGLESLGRCVDFRINGYLPVGGSAHYGKKHVFDKYIGGFRAVCHEKQFVFVGIDAEIGWRIYRLCGFSLYGAVGPYFYHQKRYTNIYGGQARLELHWKKYLRLQVSVSDDNKYGTNVQGKFILAVPFSSLLSGVYSNLVDPCRDLMQEPVRRNGVMFTERCSDYRQNWK